MKTKNYVADSLKIFTPKTLVLIPKGNRDIINVRLKIRNIISSKQLS